MQQSLPLNVVLIILDGFGLSPQVQGNAVIAAKMPFFDYMIANFKSTALHASGEAVGLPWGEMGNSEVGHLNIGAGRVVLQDFPQISRAIVDGTFFNNRAFLNAVAHVKKYHSRLHLVGLLSKGAVHSHIDHLFGLLQFAKINKIPNVFVHAILDGRDSPPKSANQLLTDLIAKFEDIKVGQLATLVGRFYAMDRDRRFDRIKVAYDAMVNGVGEKRDNPIQAILDFYQKGESDEFMPAIILGDTPRIAENDAVVFFNYRADRAIALTKAFVEKNFHGFTRKKLNNLFFVTFTNYDHNLPVEVAFSPIMLNNPSVNPLGNGLAATIAKANLAQLHIAETEKYAHVTYFFNAGNHDPNPLEKQILLPSPKTDDYSKTPEMSLDKIVQAFEENFENIKPRFSVINFANADMIGHTGNYNAACTACENIDSALSKIVTFATNRNCIVFITGDHGNVEQMINPITQEIDKEHTTNPVPFIIVDKPVEIKFKTDPASLELKLKFHSKKPIGIFADIAPTILDYLDLPLPNEMTGVSLKDMI